jgi:hypothetical protein
MLTHIGKLHCTNSLGPANNYIVPTHSGPANLLKPFSNIGSISARCHTGFVGSGISIGIGIDIGSKIGLSDTAGNQGSTSIWMSKFAGTSGADIEHMGKVPCWE